MKTFWGTHLTVVLPEDVSSMIYENRFYEEGLTLFVLKELKPGMTFLDIGAHFGYFSSLASELVGNDGQVHSFEPTRSTYEILRENVNNKSNVKLNNNAVWYEKTKITFNDFGIGLSAYNSLYNPRLDEKRTRKAKIRQYEVDAISIDEYADSLKIKPDLIKVDAESAEYEVLKGMNDVINRYRPIIIIEVGDKNVENVMKSKDLIKYLIGKGYKALEYKNGNIIDHKLQEEYAYDNIFFMPM
ncbi:FkbM family methyltransferase [Elusimicrobiota bacterium]